MRLPDWPGADDGSVAIYDLCAWRERIRIGEEAGSEYFSGSDSPNLERQRSARADILEMERDERRGLYVLASDVDAILTNAATVYREAADKAQRICPDAAEIIEDAIQELERRLGDRWESDCNRAISGDESDDSQPK